LSIDIVDRRKVESFVVIENPAAVIEPSAEIEDTAMDLYACDICGCYYDPEYGDEENLIPAGTAFNKLPSDWAGPGCDASKDDFCRLYDEEFDAFEVDDLVYEEYLD
jgi:rubredoxin